jgi:multicomponent K+:H+ antiporter subunit A
VEIWLSVLLPLAGALVAPALARRGRVVCAVTCAILAALALANLLRFADSAMAGEGLTAGIAWMSGIGLDLFLRLDGLSLLFAILILGIGLLVILYSHFYLEDEPRYGRFYGLLMLFMGAMLGIVLAESMLLLVVFWELTTITSFFLIGFHHDRIDARTGALTSIVVTGAGGLALTAAAVLLGHVTGSFELSDIADAREPIASNPLHLAIVLLVLIAAFTKSAQVPFHFWLPLAMAAPTPVSAYLHSAAMVNAGIYLLARLHPALAGDAIWLYAVAGTGMMTLLFGAFAAIFRHDLKSLLAYSTLSHLGLITFMLGLGSPLALVAALLHVINHATFKASLFMAAGIVSHESGTRDIRELGGLWRRMPRTAALAAVATASMAGVPLLNGFLSKEMFFSEALQEHRFGSLAPIVATLFGLFSVTYSARFIHDVFFRSQPGRLPRAPHDPRHGLRAPVEVLVGFCILMGVAPTLVVGRLLRAASSSALGKPAPDYDLAIWHGFTAALGLSAASLAGGVLLYVWLQRRYRVQEHVPHEPMLQRAAELLARGLVVISHRVTSFVEDISLRDAIAVVLVVALALAVWPVTRGFAPIPAPAFGSTVLGDYIVLLVLAVAAAAMIRFRHEHLIALVFAGVLGLTVALAYLRLSAPDLGLTQLCIEVVSVLLMLLALRRLPETSAHSVSRRAIGRDATLAIVSGAGAGLLAYVVLTTSLTSTSDWFLDQAGLVGAANVVNAILVDFRAFDTLGEITVLAIAAAVIFSITGTMGHARAPDMRTGTAPDMLEGHSLPMAVAARLLLPLALLVAGYLFLRGHEAPGGGFVAGLIVVIALVIQYMASGHEWADARLRIDPARWIGAGLLTATLTGLASLPFLNAFLKSAHFEPELPILGPVPFSTTLLFDAGVLLVVVGASVAYLTQLSRIPAAARDSRWS